MSFQGILQFVSFAMIAASLFLSAPDIKSNLRIQCISIDLHAFDEDRRKVKTTYIHNDAIHGTIPESYCITKYQRYEISHKFVTRDEKKRQKHPKGQSLNQLTTFDATE